MFGVLFDFLLFDRMDRRYCIKFCVKNEIKFSGIFKMLTVAFGEYTISRTQVQLWYHRINQCREDVNDDYCSGRPSSFTTLKH